MQRFSDAYVVELIETACLFPQKYYFRSSYNSLSMMCGFGVNTWFLKFVMILFYLVEYAGSSSVFEWCGEGVVGIIVLGEQYVVFIFVWINSKITSKVRIYFSVRSNSWRSISFLSSSALFYIDVTFEAAATTGLYFCWSVWSLVVISDSGRYVVNNFSVISGHVEKDPLLIPWSRVCSVGQHRIWW